MTVWIVLLAVEEESAEAAARVVQRRVEGPGHARICAVKRVEDMAGRVQWTAQDGFTAKTRRHRP